MSGARPRESNAVRKRFEERLARTTQRYEGKLALMATWEQAGGVEKHMQLQHLRRETGKLRQQLKAKGALFGDEDEK